MPIPPGSTEIEDVFEKFYAGRGHPFNDTEFSGLYKLNGNVSEFALDVNSDAVAPR